MDEAGVDDAVTILSGDALETLDGVPGPVELVLLDGWKELCLPVLRLLEPNLAPGALVAADDITHATIGPGTQRVMEMTFEVPSATVYSPGWLRFRFSRHRGSRARLLAQERNARRLSEGDVDMAQIRSRGSTRRNRSRRSRSSTTPLLRVT